MNIKICLCVIILLKICLISKCAIYSLFEVTAYNNRERRVLYDLYRKHYEFTFMNGITNEAALPINIAVENNYTKVFEKRLKAYDIQYLYFPGKYLDLETNESSIGLFASKVKDISNTFYDWESIVKWINHQCRRHAIIEKTVIAKTFQRRDIIVLKISEGDDKPIVFIVGGEDGKDWTSSAVALNFVKYILANHEKHGSLLQYFNFYIVPVLNPDGFVYSRNSDRMWSKNRQDFFPTVRCSKSFVAIGVNIARNWYFHDVKRTLHEECQGVYVGRKRLSEEETFGLSYALNTLAVNTMAFINVKGFGKFVTIPYAHSTPTNNHDIVITTVVTWPIGLRQN
ncbi:zinc carboxypeptidase-like [Leptidea sinapis]|uniref:zinc carboxypeptidase-like n=1 Tax=Leptidea sinapis TaxID=189913 RepID=UPI002129F677|nr:zinc carboxypeptidase-like [Leptidea sinapis]